MGVLDLLPDCVSSVYLMYVKSLLIYPSLIPTRYHEDFSDWNFGKLSALREINLAREGGYRFYYMGKHVVLQPHDALSQIQYT